MRLPYVSRETYDVVKAALDAEKKAHETSRFDLKAQIALLQTLALPHNADHIRDSEAGELLQNARVLHNATPPASLPWLLEQACEDIAQGSRDLRRVMLRQCWGMWGETSYETDRSTLVRIRECLRLGEEFDPRPERVSARGEMAVCDDDTEAPVTAAWYT